ncbi:MAG: FAD-dependent oxidoreductase [Saprospiraceae bacterium]|nr:FAD-dependent oxidoreductase [Saprospiraceae bacterium]MDW8228205.1 FAD-dependent oxidoreductase [Saprospiraceae bacterium]
MKETWDVIVIGAGAAGMSCAIEAGQRGLKVLVIERSERAGGALHWSGGHMSAAGCRRQQQIGIEDSPQQHLQEILEINGHTGDLDLIRLAVEEAPKTIDWLEEGGFEFAPECPRIVYGHVPYRVPRTVYGPRKGMSVYEVLRRRWESAVREGQLTALFSTQALDVLASQGKRFDTIVIDSIAGSYRQCLSARHIVFATGGYGASHRFFAQKHPGVPLVSAAYPTADGNGITLLERKGAAFRFAEYHLPSLGGLETPPKSGLTDFNHAWAMILTSVYRPPREVYLNAHGNRFMPEDEPNPDTRERRVMQQPGCFFWAIFDQAAFDERAPDGSESPLLIGWSREQFLQRAREGQGVHIAATLADLADACHLPAEAVAKEVAAFNQAVARGIDEKFGRKYLKNAVLQPPFYAVKICAAVLVTFGGIRVNTNFEVLDTSGEPLSGLYAIGEILGLGATSGSAFCSGMALTPAISFGRLLGQRLPPSP